MIYICLSESYIFIHALSLFILPHLTISIYHTFSLLSTWWQIQIWEYDFIVQMCNCIEKAKNPESFKKMYIIISFVKESKKKEWVNGSTHATSVLWGYEKWMIWKRWKGKFSYFSVFFYCYKIKLECEEFVETEKPVCEDLHWNGCWIIMYLFFLFLFDKPLNHFEHSNTPLHATFITKHV